MKSAGKRGSESVESKERLNELKDEFHTMIKSKEFDASSKGSKSKGASTKGNTKNSLRRSNV